MKEPIFQQPYNILTYNPSFYQNSFFLLQILFFVFFLLLAVSYKVEKRVFYEGYYQEGEVVVFVDQTFFQLSNQNLKIEQNSYEYRVTKITPMTYENGKTILWEVRMVVSLPKEWQIENHQFQLSFLKDKKTIFQRLIEKIKKGLRL